jgi:hypothetical protein
MQKLQRKPASQGSKSVKSLPFVLPSTSQFSPQTFTFIPSFPHPSPRPLRKLAVNPFHLNPKSAPGHMFPKHWEIGASGLGHIILTFE